MKIKEFIHGWLKNETHKSFYKKIVFVTSILDIPEDTSLDVYIVGTPKKQKWAVFKCPCLKHRIEVNLMPNKHPSWEATVKRGRLSLWPSVVVSRHPCQSHFWLKQNNIERAYFD